MKAPQLPKRVRTLSPAAIVDDAAFTFQEVDTKGFDWALFVFYIGAIDVDFAVVPKITQDDVTGMGSATDITGAVLAGTGPANASADNKFYGILVNLDGKKRFMKPAATGGNGDTGTYMAAWCELYGPELDPATAAGYGLAELIQA
jgi:hypothetical protein